jgi:uncharacterized protein YqgC (DUF456 family)
VQIALYLAGAAALLAGVAGTVLPLLPGAPLLLGGAILVAWADGFARLGWPSLVTVGVLSALTVVVDQLAAILGARAFGASRWAFYGAAVGLVAGLLLGIVGVLVGPIVGAVAFEYARNPDVRAAGRAGLGVAIGMLVGGAVKVALAITAVVVVIVAWYA